MCSILCVCGLSRSVVSDSLWPHGQYVACQAPLSMGFSTQEYWSALPCLPPGHLPHPWLEPRSLVLQSNSLPSEPPGKPLVFYSTCKMRGSNAASLLCPFIIQKKKKKHTLFLYCFMIICSLIWAIFLFILDMTHHN